jgi:hypothetical protein
MKLDPSSRSTGCLSTYAFLSPTLRITSCLRAAFRLYLPLLVYLYIHCSLFKARTEFLLPEIPHCYPFTLYIIVTCSIFTSLSHRLRKDAGSISPFLSSPSSPSPSLSTSRASQLSINLKVNSSKQLGLSSTQSTTLDFQPLPLQHYAYCYHDKQDQDE